MRYEIGKDFNTKDWFVYDNITNTNVYRCDTEEEAKIITNNLKEEMIMKNLIPVPERVKENVKKFIEKENLGELVDVMRASEHLMDSYLYHVIARKPNTSKVFHNGDWNYSCFTCWNEITQSLNYGHYNIETEEDAREICAEYFNAIK